MTWEELEKIESYLKDNGLISKKFVRKRKSLYLCVLQSY